MLTTSRDHDVCSTVPIVHRLVCGIFLSPGSEHLCYQYASVYLSMQEEVNSMWQVVDGLQYMGSNHVLS